MTTTVDQPWYFKELLQHAFKRGGSGVAGGVDQVHMQLGGVRYRTGPGPAGRCDGLR